MLLVDSKAQSSWGRQLLLNIIGPLPVAYTQQFDAYRYQFATKVKLGSLLVYLVSVPPTAKLAVHSIAMHASG